MVELMEVKSEINVKQENITINDIITKEDLDRWRIGDMVLIDAPTGKGKSYFIMNGLYDYCKENNKKILFLTNRNLLKDQFLTSLRKEHKLDIINIRNYQSIEEDIIKEGQNKIDIDMSKYDYVIADECHYFFTDALFNDKTDLVIEFLSDYCKSIVILLSATSGLTRGYFKSKGRLKEENIFSIEATYNYIDNFYFYSEKIALKKLLLNLPEGVKAIYIGGAQKAYDLSKEIPNAKFICSKSNSYYKQHSDKKTYDCIRDNQMFNCSVLCGTTVLGNGINIKDKAVKYIIIDILDLDVIKQVLGRKRINGADDTINLYIKVKSGKSLNFEIIKNKEQLKQIELLENEGEESFRQKMFKRKVCKAIYGTSGGIAMYKVNKIMFYKLKWDNHNYNLMIKKGTEKGKSLGFKMEVCNAFKISTQNTKSLEDELDEVVLDNYLNRHVGIKMFKDELGKFKDFISTNVLKVVKGSHGSVGIKTINSHFKELGLDYIIRSGREKNKENRDKTYWIIGKMDYTQKNV